MIFLQTLWKVNFYWDQPMSNEQFNQARTLLQELSHAEQFEFPCDPSVMAPHVTYS